MKTKATVRTRTAGLVLVLAVSGLAGCGAPSLAMFANRPDAVEARQITDILARGDVVAVAARLDESQRTADSESSLKLLAAQFPQRAPIDVRLVGYRTSFVKKVGGSTTEMSNVTFESRYDGAYVVTNVVLRRVDDGDRRILGLHAQALPQSLEVLNAFSLGNMGIVQYAFLLAMIAVAATIVVALVSWSRRRHITKRKWWWLLAIVLGCPFKLSVDWITGAVAIQVLTVQLFGLSATRDGLVGPWILSFSIPAGAIAFLINARQAERRSRQEPPAPSAPSLDVPAV
jgi:hypothetical protein